jgi:3-deoxy-D-arabino-heptulosonate 7-phosphate (DAHP) synthase
MNKVYSLRDIAKTIGVSPMAICKATTKGQFSQKLRELLTSHGFDPEKILRSVNQSVNLRGKSIKVVVSSVGWNNTVQAESEAKKSKEAKMVGGNGLEPMTSAMSTQCSNQLS